MYIIIRVRKNVHTMYTKEILCSDSQMLYKGVNIHMHYNTCTYSTVTCTMYVMYIIHVYIEGMVLHCVIILKLSEKCNSSTDIPKGILNASAH